MAIIVHARGCKPLPLPSKTSSSLVTAAEQEKQLEGVEKCLWLRSGVAAFGAAGDPKWTPIKRELRSERRAQTLIIPQREAPVWRVTVGGKKTESRMILDHRFILTVLRVIWSSWSPRAMRHHKPQVTGPPTGSTYCGQEKAQNLFKLVSVSSAA